MKKLLAALLAMMMLFSCVAAMADAGSEPDWTEYNTLIAEVKAETDFAAREAKMHQAEDVLMATGAILPIYYYNDLYMQKPGVEGIYSNLFGFKF
ncbi:MAG: peptide ABC transporter substrate-binding protein, partial [Clostridia bacterium]|nr:peptide ABC transporter substrate-binding protein [Clostridia bacterium]